MLRLLAIYVALNLSNIAFSQRENFTWPVGAKDLLRFDNNTLAPSSTQRVPNPDYTLEGVAVANDPETGDLLFYHDGHQVFTKFSTVMPGGTDIGGKIQGSTGQGAAIFVIPDCTRKKFIVFSNDADHSVFPFQKGKLYYSIVDMSNGIGIVTQAKTLIRSDLDEGMTVINDFPNGKSWLVAKLMDVNKFVSIPLTANATQLTNTNNHVVSNFSFPTGIFASIYTLRYNPQRGLIAMSGFLPAATVGTVNFNLQTGVVSNFVLVDNQALNNQGNAQQSMVIDVCWSPNGNKLYAITQKHMNLYQYDFSNGMNRTLIISDPASVDNGGMKVDPSGKIWVINNTLPINPLAPTSSFYVSRIHNPNATGGACNLVMNDFFLFSNAFFFFPVHAEYDPTPISAALTQSGNVSICQNDTLSLGVTNGSQYLWSNGATSASLQVSAAGSYSCQLTLANGCVVQSDTLVVSMNNAPQVFAGLDTNVSCGQKVTLQASSSEPVTLQWLGNPNPGANYPQVGNGSYIVEAMSTVTGCKNYDTVEVIEVNGNISVVANGGQICRGDSTILTASAQGQIGSVSFLWSNGSTSPSITVSPYSSSTYSVSVIDNSTQCSDNATVAVIVETLSVILTPVGLQEICRGDSVKLEVNEVPGSSYNWSNGSSTSTIYAFEEQPYYVTVSNGLCTVTSDTFTIAFKPSPLVDFEMNEFDEAAVGQIVNFTNTSEYPFGSEIQWILGNGETSSEIDYSTVYPNAGSYFPTLTIVAPNGCKATKGKVLSIFKGVEEVTVFLPNAFTPNGDGLNDVLKVDGTYIKSVEMFVHDRWGQILYYSPNQLVGWNGENLKGEEMPEGVYVVNVNVLGDDEKLRKIGKTVYLSRQ